MSHRTNKKWVHNPAYIMLCELGWDYLDEFKLHGKLVLRHNKDIQMSATIREGERLSDVLRALAERCALKGNFKITGAVKVVECTRLNNGELMHVLHREHRKRKRYDDAAAA